jgi:hypothetical protein
MCIFAKISPAEDHCNVSKLTLSIDWEYPLLPDRMGPSSSRQIQNLLYSALASVSLETWNSIPVHFSPVCLLLPLSSMISTPISASRLQITSQCYIRHCSQIFKPRKSITSNRFLIDIGTSSSTNIIQRGK